MKVKIQEETPYPYSIKWKIHNNYFQKKGADAWKKNEVPCGITSNPRMAYQKAKVVVEIINNNQVNIEGKIYILEIGAGLGLFALNFFKQFKEICKKENKNFHNNVHYLLTDYSEKNLKDISSNKYISKLRKTGSLDLYIMDALNPQSIKKLDGEKFDLKKESLMVVIANYVHCTLPLTIFVKKNDRFHERNIELFYNTDENIEITDENKFIEDLINNPIEKKVLEKLEEKIKYKEIDINEYIKDETERESLVQAAKDFGTATIIFPSGSFQHIKAILPFMKAKGAFLISDKGHPLTSFMGGEKEFFPSVHGNSLAHDVNMPLIEIYANKLGLSSMRTSNVQYCLQSMLIIKNNNIDENVSTTFKNQFIDNNINEDVDDFLKVACDYWEKKDLAVSISFYLKALRPNPDDSNILYCLGRCYFECGDYHRALECYTKRDDDYFNTYNFNFEIARTLHTQANYQKAIDYYNKALSDPFHQEKYIYYNIGLCWYSLKNYVQAYKYYKKALETDNTYEVALNGMQNIKNALFEIWVKSIGETLPVLKENKKQEKLL